MQASQAEQAFLVSAASRFWVGNFRLRTASLFNAKALLGLHAPDLIAGVQSLQLGGLNQEADLKISVSVGNRSRGSNVLRRCSPPDAPRSWPGLGPPAAWWRDQLCGQWRHTIAFPDIATRDHLVK